MMWRESSVRHNPWRRRRVAVGVVCGGCAVPAAAAARCRRAADARVLVQPAAPALVPAPVPVPPVAAAALAEECRGVLHVAVRPCQRAARHLRRTSSHLHQAVLRCRSTDGPSRVAPAPVPAGEGAGTAAPVTSLAAAAVPVPVPAAAAAATADAASDAPAATVALDMTVVTGRVINILERSSRRGRRGPGILERHSRGWRRRRSPLRSHVCVRVPKDAA